MASKQDSFTLIRKRMQQGMSDPHARHAVPDMPQIADLIRRIDHALMVRRAA